MFQIDSSLLTVGFQKNSFGEKYLYTINQNTFASVSSDIFFKQEYSDILNRKNTLFLIIGTDSGLLIKYLFDNPPPRGSTYLFIEFTEVIEFALLDFQPDENKRIYLTDYTHWTDVAKQYELTKYLYTNHVVTIQSVCVKDNFFPQYKLLLKQIEQELSDLKWKHSISSGAKEFIKTQIENLNENQHSAVKLKNLLHGKTAVLLAGGPSLDLYLDWVEENREKLVVIAVSRIAKRLLNTNIVPDFFAAIDPHQVGFEVSKEVLLFSDKSVLLNHYHLSPYILSQWQGPTFFVGPRYPWNTLKQPEYFQAPGPTVTNIALQIAIFMGVKKIILLGVDLCYSSEGYSHASGSMEHKAGPITSSICQLVTTNEGNTAETDNAFFNAIKNLDAQAKYAKENNCQFINPSPHSAKIENVNYIPIDQIKLNPTKLEPSISLVNCKLPEDINSTQKEYYQELLQEIERTQLKLKKIIKLTQKALDYNQKLFKNDAPEENFKYKIKMDKLEKHLNNDFDGLTNLCRNYGIESFLRFLKPALEELSDKEVKEWGDMYYDAYNSGSKALSKLLNEAKRRTQNRILEFDMGRNINKLCSFWEEEQSPGRVLFFKSKYPSEYERLTHKELKRINQTVDAYNDLVNSEPEKTIQYAKIKQRTDLSGSEVKASGLFSQNDSDGLNRMLKGLKQHTGEKAKDLLHLTEGYLFEIQGNEEEAIKAYKQIIEGHALEAGLKQLSLIYLTSNDLSSAETALYNLACMSLTYVPKLANLYKIQKRYKDALDTYTSYLDVFPEDIMTLAKLASLYQEINEIEAAQFVYKHILTIDQDNKVAKTHLEQLQK